MSASMNSKNAVAGDLFVVNGNVNGSANNNKNITTVANATVNDMSSTSTTSSITANTENGADRVFVSEKCATKIDCHPNDDNNSSTIAITSNINGSGTCTGTNIGKSWYARCNNRWRSQSCDRKHKNMVMRYSWNMAAINRLA